jgi:hypothetical protein
MSGMKKAFLVLGLGAAVGCVWPFAARAACGCSGMALKHAGNTGTVCSNANLQFLATECTKSTGSTKGCSTTYAYDCNLGVNSQKHGNVKPYQKTGFQSRATLTSGSNVSDCRTGQILQETIHSGPKVEPNPQINPTSVHGVHTIGGKQIHVDNNGANAFPQVGAMAGSDPKYGGDDYASYTADDVLFGYDPASRLLTWWDNPDQSKDSQSEAADWHFKFVSFVLGTGSEPSCACAFDIKVTWPSNSKSPATTYTYDAAGSTGCTW